MDWDQYFMSLAYLVAMKSKDIAKKVGTVVVDARNEILTTGYNGFPRGFDDDAPERQKNPTKLLYTVHSELNACLAASRKGVSLEGSRAYVTWSPCDKCALALVQSGITEVIVHKENSIDGSSWEESILFAKEILAEGKVAYREWSGDLAKPAIFTKGAYHHNETCCLPNKKV